MGKRQKTAPTRRTPAPEGHHLGPATPRRSHKQKLINISFQNPEHFTKKIWFCLASGLKTYIQVDPKGRVTYESGSKALLLQNGELFHEGGTTGWIIDVGLSTANKGPTWVNRFPEYPGTVLWVESFRWPASVPRTGLPAACPLVSLEKLRERAPLGFRYKFWYLASYPQKAGEPWKHMRYDWHGRDKSCGKKRPRTPQQYCIGSENSGWFNIRPSVGKEDAAVCDKRYISNVGTFVDPATESKTKRKKNRSFYWVATLVRI